MTTAFNPKPKQAFNNRVWKYPLAGTGEIELELPEDSKPVRADLDTSGELCLWAAVDPEKELRKFIVVVTATGDETDYSMAHYLGSVRKDAEMLHVFGVGFIWD